MTILDQRLRPDAIHRIELRERLDDDLAVGGAEADVNWRTPRSNGLRLSVATRKDK